MIITSDWHLRGESADTVFGQVIPGIVDACRSAGDYTAVCCGDLFHIRYKVDARLLNTLRDYLRWGVDGGVDWHILPGNHDQYSVDGRNVLEVLQDIDGVTVYTNPTRNSLGLWLPYRKSHDELLGAIQQQCSGGVPSGSVAFVHHGFSGAFMNNHFVNDTGLSPQDFSQFRWVFSGHYHKHQVLGNVVYVGSPYQTKADEAGQPKGFIRYVHGQDWEFCPQQWGKRYVVDRIDDVADLAGLSLSPGDEVRLKAGPGVDVRLVTEALEKAGVKNHVVTPEQAAVEQRLDVGDGAPIQDYATAYVDLVNSKLDREKLLRVFQELSA